MIVDTHKRAKREHQSCLFRLSSLVSSLCNNNRQNFSHDKISYVNPINWTKKEKPRSCRIMFNQWNNSVVDMKNLDSYCAWEENRVEEKCSISSTFFFFFPREDIFFRADRCRSRRRREMWMDRYRQTEELKAAKERKRKEKKKRTDLERIDRRENE